jgi:hypothetical protein
MLDALPVGHYCLISEAGIEELWKWIDGDATGPIYSILRDARLERNEK